MNYTNIKVVIIGESKLSTESASFEVYREKGTFGRVSVLWNVTSSSGANPALDVSPVSGHVTFSPSERSTFINITSLPDKVRDTKCN